MQAIYVPADDYTDPAPATTFAHLDATTNLSRQIVEMGIYPAVDPLEGTSRILDPRVVGIEHYTVARARKIQRFLSQPFHVAEQFTGHPGKYVKLADTIRGFKEIPSKMRSNTPSSRRRWCRVMAETFLLEVATPESLLVRERATRRCSRSWGKAS